jgi:hypothetical protein
MLTKCASIYKSASNPNKGGYWKPRPELTPPAFSTLTIMFVTSLHIYYKDYSDDPIFPADKADFLTGDEKPWFVNSDPRARPLACINSIEVCLGDGKTCWAFNDPELENITGPPDFILMYASLRRTEVYNMIEKRLGRGLIAQSKVSQFYSEGLGSHQWVDEVEHMFATINARTQINTWSIARGEDSNLEEEGYRLITKKGTYGDLCGMFKYNPPGYTSIHATPFGLVLFSFPLFLFLSRKWPVWPYPWPWRKEPPENAVEVEPEVPGTGAAEQVAKPTDAATPTPHTVPTTGQAENDSDPSGSSSAGAIMHSGEEQPATQSAGPSANPDDVAATSASHSENLPLGGDDEEHSREERRRGKLPDRSDPTSSRGVGTGTNETGQTGSGAEYNAEEDQDQRPAVDPSEIKWEPLVMGKIIELLVTLFLVRPLWALRNPSDVGPAVKRKLKFLFRRPPRRGTSGQAVTGESVHG